MTPEQETIAENAACLWEAILEADPTGETHGDGFPFTMRRAAKAEGMAQFRTRVTQHAEAVESGWKAAQDSGFVDCFDWEFCPVFVARCIDWETGGLVADWLDVCRAIGTENGERVA